MRTDYPKIKLLRDVKVAVLAIDGGVHELRGGRLLIFEAGDGSSQVHVDFTRMQPEPERAGPAVGSLVVQDALGKLHTFLFDSKSVYAYYNRVVIDLEEAKRAGDRHPVVRYVGEDV